MRNHDTSVRFRQPRPLSWSWRISTLALIAGSMMLAPVATWAAESNEKTARVEVGQQAPDFTLESSEGQSYSLGQLRGGEKHLVMVFFRGTW